MLFIPTLMALGIAGASFHLLFPAAAGDTHNAAISRLWFGGSISVFLISLQRMTAFLCYDEKINSSRKVFAVILFVPAVLIAIITVIFKDAGLLRYLGMIFLVLLAMVIAITYNWFSREDPLLNNS